MSRRGGDGGPSGICVVDKPAGWTSHDVVARARKLLGTRKVGHAGTLDPMATGVLVLGVGRATRLLTFITGVAKTYEATIRFGVETDSLDADGQVTATHDMSGMDPAAVRAAAALLTGDLLQVPPMVSALKVEGRRLHELAREGVEVERPPRPVTVRRFEVTPTDDPLEWTAVVDCSSGHLRAVAGSGPGFLPRRRCPPGGPATHRGGALRAVRGPRPGAPGAAGRWPRGCATSVIVVVDAEVAAAVRHGRVLDAEQLGLAAPIRPDAGPWAVLSDQGALLAVYQRRDDQRAKPAIVLAVDAG